MYEGSIKIRGPSGLVAKSHGVDLSFEVWQRRAERDEAGIWPWLKQPDYQWGIEGDYTCKPIEARQSNLLPLHRRYKHATCA